MKRTPCETYYAHTHTRIRTRTAIIGDLSADMTYYPSIYS